jgi:hypothetical protein
MSLGALPWKAGRFIVATRDGEIREITANFLQVFLGLVQLSFKKERRTRSVVPPIDGCRASRVSDDYAER